MQGVEPAAGLINGLADIIGREMLLEQLAVFERVMPLLRNSSHRNRTSSQ